MATDGEARLQLQGACHDMRTIHATIHIALRVMVDGFADRDRADPQKHAITH
jgi:hypothetical protein